MHAYRLQINFSFVVCFCWRCAILSLMNDADNSGLFVVNRGLSAELLVAAQFAAVGGIPSFPLRPCSYDLIVDFDGKLWRVQTKHAGWRPATHGRDRAHYSVELLRKTRPGKVDKRRRITDFDYLAVVCAPERIYVIPVGLLEALVGGGLLRRALMIKPIEDAGFREDAWKAAARWEPYRNYFDLRIAPDPVPTRVPCAAPPRKVYTRRAQPP